jgi:hypothetical protein
MPGRHVCSWLPARLCSPGPVLLTRSARVDRSGERRSATINEGTAVGCSRWCGPRLPRRRQVRGARAPACGAARSGPVVHGRRPMAWLGRRGLTAAWRAWDAQVSGLGTSRQSVRPGNRSSVLAWVRRAGNGRPQPADPTATWKADTHEPSTRPRRAAGGRPCTTDPTAPQVGALAPRTWRRRGRRGPHHCEHPTSALSPTQDVRALPKASAPCPRHPRPARYPPSSRGRPGPPTSDQESAWPRRPGARTGTPGPLSARLGPY